MYLSFYSRKKLVVWNFYRNIKEAGPEEEGVAIKESFDNLKY